MPYILALDQGTTSSRAILFDQSGQIRSVAQQEFPQIFPQPGWVEHDPMEIWASQSAVATEVLSRSGLRARDVAAIGITNQRETAVVWDRASGEPIHNAIVWQDRRTAGVCDRLRAEGQAKTFQQKTGLVVDAYFSGTKIQWILDHVPGARERAAAGELAFGTIDSWLIWKLTEGAKHLTDVTNASRTLLYNIHDGDWDDELLGILDVPRAMLPEVRSSSEVYAETSCVFSKSLPIAGIAGDQQAALFGQVCTKQGMGKNTYGTGAFLLMNTGSEAVTSQNNLVSTIAWQLGDQPIQYALEGSIFVAGAVVQWLRDGLGIIRSAPETEQLATRVDSTDGVYLVPAFVGLGAPYWDPYARGTIVGLTRGTTSAHLARAALESIAFQTVDVIRAQEADSGLDLTELRVDGGAANNDLLMQIQSDLLGVPVIRPQVTETTALGAAYLAGLAVGFWKDTDEIATQWAIDKRFEPAISRDEATERLGNWKRAVGRSRDWIEPDNN